MTQTEQIIELRDTPISQLTQEYNALRGNGNRGIDGNIPLNSRIHSIESVLRDIITPANTDGNVGSTGSADITHDTTNQRIRGWAREGNDLFVVRDISDLSRLNEITNEAWRQYNDTSASRISLRVVTENPELLYNNVGQLNVEAVIPISGDRFNSLSVVYLGHNDDSRLSNEVSYQQQCNALENLIDNYEPTPRTRTEIPEGYNIEQLSDPTVRDVEQVVELMSRAYTRDEEVIMWYEPTIGNIVSISISEPAEGLRIEGEEIIAYEVSDCATFPAHRNRGLLQACFEGLLETPEMSQADMVFSES